MDRKITIHTFILATLFCVLSSCEPTDRDYFNNEVVKLKGQLNNNNDTVHVNDTLIFTLNLPSAIIGTTQNVTVNSLQEGFYYLHLQKLDTVTKVPKVILPADPEAKYFVNPGSQSNAAIHFRNDLQPYVSKLHIIPKEKGVYYLEVIIQPGRLKVNGNYEARLIVNFDVTNKHHQMLARYYGNDWLNGVTQRDAEGIGLYGFIVD